MCREVASAPLHRVNAIERVDAIDRGAHDVMPQGWQPPAVLCRTCCTGGIHNPTPCISSCLSFQGGAVSQCNGEVKPCKVTMVCQQCGLAHNGQSSGYALGLCCTAARRSQGRGRPARRQLLPHLGRFTAASMPPQKGGMSGRSANPAMLFRRSSTSRKEGRANGSSRVQSSTRSAHTCRWEQGQQ